MKKEIEIKYRLDNRESLDRVRLALENQQYLVDRTLQQRNYFFDLAGWELNSMGWTIRLRRENSDNFLTVKSRLDTQNTNLALAVKLEYELSIDDQLAEDLSEGRRDFREVIESTETKHDKTRQHVVHWLAEITQGMPLLLKGSFSNERRCVPVRIEGEDFVLELDTTTFPNGEVHFEVELELKREEQASTCQTFLKRLFHQAQVPFTNSTGKAERFFRIIQSGF